MKEGHDSRKSEVPVSWHLLIEHVGGRPTPWLGRHREASVSQRPACPLPRPERVVAGASESPGRGGLSPFRSERYRGSLWRCSRQSPSDVQGEWGSGAVDSSHPPLSVFQP